MSTPRSRVVRPSQLSGLTDLDVHAAKSRGVDREGRAGRKDKQSTALVGGTTVIRTDQGKWVCPCCPKAVAARTLPRYAVL